MIREDCKYIAWLYHNDRTDWSKPACLEKQEGYPECDGCKKFEKNSLVISMAPKPIAHLPMHDYQTGKLL